MNIDDDGAFGGSPRDSHISSPSSRNGGLDPPIGSRNTHHQETPLPATSRSNSVTGRPASTSVHSSSVSTATAAPLSPNPPPAQRSSRRASHAPGESRHQGVPSVFNDVYSHPAAVAYAAAHPRRTIPKFGPYLLLQTLGEGEFGKVKLGLHGEYGEEVAVKLIRRGSVDNTVRFSKIEREIEVLKTIKHPNIVRLYDVIETDKYIGIILEYASGGELFDHILAHRYLKERDAAKLFAQLISGVSYIHSKKIVHRDLKLENLLLDRNRNVIITDFGFANRFEHKADDLMQTSCGSPCYAAPELVISEGLYVGSAVDIWSCGVILYAMLAGYLPFDDDPANPEGDNINLLYKYIINTQLTFPDYVSTEARDLLGMMLVPDPARRCDLEQIKMHIWLRPYVSLFEKSVQDLETQAMEIQNAKRLAYQKQMRTREAQLAMQQVKMNRTQSARLDTSSAYPAGMPASSSASTRTKSGRDPHHEFLYETSGGASGVSGDLLPPTTGRRAVASAIIPTAPREADAFSPITSNRHHDGHSNAQYSTTNGDSPVESRSRKESTRSKSSRTGKSSTKPSAIPSPPPPQSAVAASGKKKGGYRHTIQLEYDDTQSHSSQILQPSLPTPPPLFNGDTSPLSSPLQNDVFFASPMADHDSVSYMNGISVPASSSDPQSITTTTIVSNGITQSPPSMVETSYSAMPLADDMRLEEVNIDQSPSNIADMDEEHLATPKKGSPVTHANDTPRAKKSPIPMPSTPLITPPSPTLKRAPATEPAIPTSYLVSNEDRNAAPASPSTMSSIPPPVSPSGQQAHLAANAAQQSPASVASSVSVALSQTPSATSSQKSSGRHRKGLSMDKFNLSKFLSSSSSNVPLPSHEDGKLVSNGTSSPTSATSVGRSPSNASKATRTSSKPPTTGPKRPPQDKRASTTVSSSVSTTGAGSVTASDQTSVKSKKSRRTTLSILMGEQFGNAKAAVRDRTSKSARSTTEPPSATKETPPPLRLIEPMPSTGKATEVFNEKASIPASATTALHPSLSPVDLEGDAKGPTASTGKAKRVMDWFRKKSLAKNDSPFAPERSRHTHVTAIFPNNQEKVGNTHPDQNGSADPSTPTLETYRAASHINSSSSTINNAPQLVVTSVEGATAHAPSTWNPSSRTASGQSHGSTESAHSTNANGGHPPAASSSAKRADGTSRSSPAATRPFNKTMLRVHHGAVDQATITSGSPPEVFEHVTQVLLSMGMDIQKESQYKYRCIRHKRRKSAAPNGKESASGLALSAFSMHGSAASNGVDRRGLPVPSSASFGGPTGMLRGLLRRGPSHAAGHSPQPSETESSSGLLSPTDQRGSESTSSPSATPSEPLYGDRNVDQQDEVRFSVELTRIDGLDDTYSLDIRRLKGNLRSYKFLYDTLRERATPA